MLLPPVKRTAQINVGLYVCSLRLWPNLLTWKRRKDGKMQWLIDRPTNRSSSRWNAISCSAISGKLWWHQMTFAGWLQCYESMCVCGIKHRLQPNRLLTDLDGLWFAALLCSIHWRPGHAMVATAGVAASGVFSCISHSQIQRLWDLDLSSK